MIVTVAADTPEAVEELAVAGAIESWPTVHSGEIPATLGHGFSIAPPCVARLRPGLRRKSVAVTGGPGANPARRRNLLAARGRDRGRTALTASQAALSDILRAMAP